MEETVLYLIANAFRIYLSFYLLSIFYKEKKVSPNLIFLYGVVFFILNSYLYLRWNIPVVNTLDNILFLFCTAFLYVGKWQQYIFLPIAIVTLNGISETLAVYIPLIDIKTISDFHVGISSVISDFLFLIFIIIIKKIYKNKENLPFTYWCALFVIPILSLLEIYTLIYRLSIMPKQIILSLIILIVINISIFWLYDQLSGFILQQNHIRITEEQNKLFEVQIEALHQSERQLESLRSMRHDMKEHDNDILVYLEQNRVDDAIQYLKDCGADIVDYSSETISGNILIDGIISRKKREAEEKQIDFQMDIQIPTTNIIRENDMCAILFNLLDNAIEAQDILPASAHRFIHVTLKSKGSTWLICIKNSCNPKLKIAKDAIPCTTKKNPWQHGIGLKNVVACTQKYNGTYSFTAEDGVFTALLFVSAPVSIFEQLDKLMEQQESPDTETAANAAK